MKFNELNIIFDKKQKISFFLYYFLSILIVIFDLIGLGFIYILFDLFINQQESIFFDKFTNIKFLNFENEASFLKDILILFPLIYILKNILFLLFHYIKRRIFEDLKISTFLKMFDIYKNKNLSFHVTNNTQKIYQYIYPDVINTFTFYELLDQFFTIFIFSFFTAIFLLLSAPYSIFLLLIFILILFCYSFYFNKIFYKFGKQSRKFNIKILNNIEYAFGAFKENLIFDKFYNYKSKLLDIFFHQKKIAIKRKIFGLFPKTIIELCIVFLAFLFFIKILDGDIDENLFPKIGILILATIKLAPGFSNLGSQLSSLNFFLKSKNFIINELQKAKKYNLISRKKNVSFKNLKLNNIVFKYEQSKTILRNVNLEINKGDKIKIDGKSGSGKTTLLNIICGFLNPTKGKVIFNGKKINNLHELTSSNFVNYVPQDIFLINDTIKYNITLQDNFKKINNKLLKKCINTACLDDYLRKLHSGLNTQIGSKGQKLSGGLKQRLGIARALYNNAQILIMDESTSFIDKQIEKKIFKNLKINFSKNTIIVVSHYMRNKFSFNKNVILKDGLIKVKKVNIQ